jgi:predicted RNA binding protein YcfA (HicA-like mRNA interferase family)
VIRCLGSSPVPRGESSGREKLSLNIQRQRGSPASYAHSAGRPATVPIHPSHDVARGTLGEMIRAAEVSVDGFTAPTQAESDRLGSVAGVVVGARGRPTAVIAMLAAVRRGAPRDGRQGRGMRRSLRAPRPRPRRDRDDAACRRVTRRPGGGALLAPPEMASGTGLLEYSAGPAYPPLVQVWTNTPSRQESDQPTLRATKSPTQ